MSEREHDPLVDTAAAAAAVGVATRSFRTWARRRGVEPVDRVRVGRRQLAYYRLSDVYAATRVRSQNGLIDKLKTA